MKKIYYLQDEYIYVNPPLGDLGETSFGGCQGWFGEEDIIRSQGCGLIAMTDLILYLSRQYDGFAELLRDCDTSEYKGYMRLVRKINQKYVGLRKLPRINMNNIDGRMGRILNACFNDCNIPLKAAWGTLNPEKKVRGLLSRDIPAVISAGPCFFGSTKGVKCFVKSGDSLSDTGKLIRNHYFTVTAVCEENHDTFYEISSWGARFFINEKQLRRYRRLNIPIFSSVLSISEK